MNDAQHAALSGYIRDLADALLLRDWEITLERGWSDSDAYATISVWAEENHANVNVCEGFFGHSAEERREWLTHELMHIHLDRPDRLVRKVASQVDNNSAMQLAKDLHHDEIEICVQRLARILAPFLPLPPGVSA